MDEDVLRVFAYGTLRTGASNYDNAGMSLCESEGIHMLQGYRMYAVPNNGQGSADYPGVAMSGVSSELIVGEVFKLPIDDETRKSFLNSLDSFENDDVEPEYERVIVSVAGFPCYMYLYIKNTVGLEIVVGGNWLSSAF